MLCRHGLDRGCCKKSSVLYKIECNREPCRNSSSAIYFGETYKSGFLRGEEHDGLYVTQRDTSMMWAHCQDKHEGEIGVDHGRFDFRMSVVHNYKDAMSRQAAESTRVRRLEDQDMVRESVCLNSRLDWVKTTGVKLIPTRGATKKTPSA